ncbi:DUF2332 domain-containing protein [Phytoactinopolyspora limicola]|uniref:DUF2332 domain-containing protein n=1 Tax=Phytoactinopolyspora limicola TaxID=2715536 RepID=UPI001407331E|nr:DUF2332 domain-containing protein [Phytoactinopolyspora limicola]
MAASTSEQYRNFAEKYARGTSPTYERLAHTVAADSAMIELIDQLPPLKRQPNLLFGAARYLGGPVGDPAAFSDWVRDHWTEVSDVMRNRRTQTNEAGRCAVLLPVLAQLPQPLALLEVGASAGLCLYPDVYRYRYGAHVVGPASGPVELACAVKGDVPLPEQVPTVTWRAGLDLNPIDLTDDDALRWLDALIWPEHHERSARLHAAAAAIRSDPPDIRRGDLLTDLPALAAEAPADATLVVFHSAVIAYVDPTARATFESAVRQLPGHWISNESLNVFPHITAQARLPADAAGSFLLALDGHPVALTEQHGRSITWLGPSA